MYAFRCLLVVCVAGLFCSASRARGGVDEGVAHYMPWSGSFWPIRQGLLIRGPLTQYDRSTGRQAARWEFETNPPLPEVPYWFGYCHAWASAAVMDREPTRLRQVPGRDSVIGLGIGDQKGMLTACHTNDVAQHYGVRYTGAAEEDPNDIYPDDLWRVLRLYIRQQGVPIIMDIDAGTQVWNYPVFAYQIHYRPTGRGNEQFAEMSLWMSDDAVPPDFVGVKIAKQSCFFTFELQGGMARAGSARWVGPSVRDHPDFAWFPQVPVANNPEIKYATVKRLVDASGSGPLSGRPPRTGIAPPARAPGTQPSRRPNWIPARPGAASLVPDDQPMPISPVELLSVLINKTSAFDLDVTVDKFDGGRYTPGEPFVVSGVSAKAGFLYLLYLDAEGQLAPLFPPPGVDNRIAAQTRFRLPAPGSPTVFRTRSSPGTHRLKAVVTTTELGLPGVSLVSDGAAVPDKRAAEFYLPPSQKALFKDIVGRYQAARPIRNDELGGASPLEFLGEFAQDEVAFYVGAAEPPAEGAEP